MVSPRGLYGMRLGLPPREEIGDGRRVHVAHVAELGGLLGVDDVAGGVKDGEGGHSLFERYAVLVGYVEILVEVADVDVHEDVVVVEEVEIRSLMEVDIEDLAVAAPVAAEVEEDALVFCAGLLQGCGNFSVGVGLRRVEMLFDCRWSSDWDALRRLFMALATGHGYCDR